MIMTGSSVVLELRISFFTSLSPLRLILRVSSYAKVTKDKAVNAM